MDESKFRVNWIMLILRCSLCEAEEGNRGSVESNLNSDALDNLIKVLGTPRLKCFQRFISDEVGRPPHTLPKQYHATKLRAGEPAKSMLTRVNLLFIIAEITSTQWPGIHYQ